MLLVTTQITLTFVFNGRYIYFTMKVSFVVAALALAAPVFGQSILDSLPKCAGSCLLGGLSSSGCEDPVGDLECVCNSDAFVQSAATCIIASCEGADETKAIQGAYQLCLANGVTIPTVFPGQDEPTSTSAAPEEEETPAPEETTTEAPVEEPTEVVEVTSTFTTITGTGSGPIPTNGTNTIPPVPTATEGAATRMGVSLGALGLAIAGFVAL